MIYCIYLFLTATPPALIDVVIHPSTILALILWQVKDDGGYPIIFFTAQYKLANSDEEWTYITPINMSPNSVSFIVYKTPRTFSIGLSSLLLLLLLQRQIDVYKLEPNTTYAFRIWGTNQLGEGEIVEVESTTLKIYEEIGEFCINL